MTTLLFLITFALAIAFAYLNDKLGSLRSQIEELREISLDRMRQLHRRIEVLEKASAERRMEVPEPIPQPAPRAVAPPIPGPIPPIAEPIQLEKPATPLQEWIAASITPPATLVARIETPAEPKTEPAPELLPEPTFIPAPTAYQPAEYRQKTPDRAEEPARTLSLEERLGGNWLAKIGVSILVIGVAFFLAPRLLNMGPVGKSLTGIAISLTLLLGGLWLERKPPYRVFARAGISGGWALLFFTTFAMHHFEATRVIDSLLLDLVLMLLVAGGMVLHSLRYNSQTVTGLAFLLAFATLATSDFESTSGTVVFSLIASAVLALGLVVVTTIRHWARLELAGLIAVLGSHFLWLSLLLPVLGGKAGFPLYWQSTALILFYWALFRAAYLLRVPLNEEEDRISSLSAVVLSGGVLGLLKLQSAHPEWAFRALLAMGTIEMLLGLWIGFWARNRRRSAFAVLTTIATVLLVAAIPFQFHGISWPVLWLVEAHILALCGLRLGEPIFRRLGLLAGFGASLVLLGKLFLLANFRLESPDPGRHPSLTIGLALAAALFWLHGEVYPRRFAKVASSLDSGVADAEQMALAVTSWLGLGAAAAALWVVLPAQWIAVGWLTLALAMGFAADWKNLLNIALQADLLAVLAIPALIYWDFAYASQKRYELPEAIAIALLYAGMRRRTVLENSPAYVAPAYSWAASALALVWVSETVADRWLALSWLGLAVALFALGWHFQKGFLRWQGYLAAACAFCALQGPWLLDGAWIPQGDHGWFHVPGSELLTLLAIAASLYALQEALRRGQNKIGPVEQGIGMLAGALATLALTARLPLLVASWGVSESASTAWAVFAVLLLAVAWFARRRPFQLHAIALCLWAGLYGITRSFNLLPKPLPWWQTDLFRLSLESAILIAGLIFAFPLRKRATEENWSASWPPVAQRPEQWFFFVPFGLMIVTLAAELRPGQLTLGWSLLGLAAFIFALPLGERSFRLSGLALMLLCVAKVLLMDVWTYGPTDRYITLIVTGATLTVVSFLYARLRDFLRKYL
jgi:hypothetical protein